MIDNENLVRTVAFLDAIGIASAFEPGASGFLSMVCIVNGTLLIDPRCAVADLLHEAGHLAIIPARYRHRFSIDVGNQVLWNSIMKEIKGMQLHPDHPLFKAVLQCSDPEATAWQWAAGVAIGLPPEVIIQDDSLYNSEGFPVGQEERLWFSVGHHFGIQGLAAAGMCDLPRRGGFPKMKKWLQDADIDQGRKT